MDKINAFKCVCQLGYAGRVCETSKLMHYAQFLRRYLKKDYLCGLRGEPVLILIVLIEFEQRPLVLLYAGHILKSVYSPLSPRYR